MASQQVTGNVGMYYAYRLSRMGWNVPLAYEREDALPEEPEIDDRQPFAGSGQGGCRMLGFVSLCVWVVTHGDEPLH
jgi:hypothetical protein